MKTTVFVLYLNVIIWLIGCNSSIEKRIAVKCDNYLNGKQTTSKIVDIYEIDTAFYKYLDTIIRNEPKYRYYNQCYSGFLFSISQVQRSENSDFDEIFIGSINKYMYNYTRCYGIFEYKGTTFLCDSLCDRRLLHSTNRKKSVKYLVIYKYLCQDDIDDKYSIWYFTYNDNMVKLTGHYYPY